MMGLHVFISPSVPYIPNVSPIIKGWESIVVLVVMVVASILALSTASVSLAPPSSSLRWFVCLSVIIQILVGLRVGVGSRFGDFRASFFNPSRTV